VGSINQHPGVAGARRRGSMYQDPEPQPRLPQKILTVRRGVGLDGQRKERNKEERAALSSGIEPSIQAGGVMFKLMRKVGSEGGEDR